MADNNANLFQRLTKLFRSGPTIKRKVRNFKEPVASTALEIFKRSHSNVYSNSLSAYGSFDRMSRYSDFSEMEATPEISSALDIYSEETVSQDDSGKSLHIYSDNKKVQEILEALFYETLNIEFNLSMWVRNLCKYGDFFLFNDVSPEYGVINAYPIPISEIEREEGFDPEDPSAVRFRWITMGNQVLQNWQVSHFRLLGSDAFLPYGSSVLESARRIWRQLILIEDAMLVYRVIRAPERRVFYIDVGNVPPENVGTYLEQAKTALKRNQTIDKNNGRVDLRYNPLSVDEDYFLPVRGGESGTKIDTLAGGQNTAAIEDVEYIQKKLFAALKIPKAYLGYDEEIGAKATLAQEDIRFSRSIQRIQKTVISELNKLAMIHLYSHGYEGDDLVDFELFLSNPSSIAQQQKLELIRSKFEIAGTAPEGMVSREWIRKNILSLTEEEIKELEKGIFYDKETDLKLEAVKIEEEGDAGGGDEGGGGDDKGGGGDEGGGLFSGDVPTGVNLITSMKESDEQEDADDIDEDDEVSLLSIDDDEAPTRVEKSIRNAFNEPIKKSRKVTSGPLTTHMPDLKKMVSTGKSGRKQDTLMKPYDNDFILSAFGEGTVPKNPDFEKYLDKKMTQRATMTKEMQGVLNNLSNSINISKPSVLLEGPDDNLDLDLDLEFQSSGDKE